MWLSKLVKRIYLVEKFLTHSPSLRKTVPLTFDNLLGQFPGQSKENIVYFISFPVHSLWRRANAWNISFETLDSGNLHNQLFWHVTLSHQLSTTDREIVMGLYLVTVHQQMETKNKGIIQHHRLISVKNLECFWDGCLPRRVDGCSKLVFCLLAVCVVKKENNSISCYDIITLSHNTFDVVNYCGQVDL